MSLSTSAFAIVDNDTPIKLDCKAALLIENNTGTIVYEYNSHEKLPPASVTKIGTMLMIMESVDSGAIKLSDKVTCSSRVKSMGGSTMFLDEGEIRTVEELLKGVAVESANDAAVALAEFHSGTEEAFVEKLNLRLQELGCKETHFSNCTGLFPDNHYTSAYDLGIMSRELLKHKQILKYTSIWMETISDGRQTPFTLVNRNKMLKGYNGCDGLKTGFINEAKYCISATALRNNVRFISIIIGAPTWKSRNEQAGKLLDLGFSKYESKNLVKKNDPVGELKLSKTVPESVTLRAQDDLNTVSEKGKAPKIEMKVNINNSLKLPIKKGSVVGNIEARDGDIVYGKANVITDTDITKMSYTYMLNKVVKKFLYH